MLLMYEELQRPFKSVYEYIDPVRMTYSSIAHVSVESIYIAFFNLASVMR